MHYPSQVALITGAARRIGAALARALHGAGFNLVIHYRHSKMEAEALALELNQTRVNSAVAVYADLYFSEQCAQLIQMSYQQWQRLDVLINNASTYYPTSIGETTPEQVEDLINSNFKAPFFLSQYAKDYLQQSSGCILNIADVNAFQPLRDYSVYCAAKSALVMLTKALAKELAPSIRVNCIAPGSVLWPEGVNEVTAQKQKEILAKIPMGRVATVADVCDTAVFLVKQSYLNGQIICVDGGKI